MRSSKLCLCTVFTLLSFPLTAAVAAACPTQISVSPPRTRIVSTQVVGTDCYFRPAPTNAMRIYEKVETVYQDFVIEQWEQCDGSIAEVGRLLGRQYSSFCWRPTNTACEGNQDWQPSPLCN